MIGPELQSAISTALKLASVASGRVYVNNVPPDAVFPYVEYAGEQVIDDGNTCSNGWEVYVSLDVWARPVDGDVLAPETAAKIVASDLVEAALTPFAMPSYRVVVAAFDGANDLDDPDGITKRRRVTLRYLIDES